MAISNMATKSSNSDFDLGSYLIDLRANIGNVGHLLRLDRQEQSRIRDELIKENFTYHYLNNAFYQDFCREQRVSPDTILNEGIEHIPLIPVRMFKDRKNADLLLTTPEDEMELEIFSTGTSGIPSIAKRDKESCDNLALILSGLYREFFEIITGAGLFLCPSPAETPEMGMVRAFNFLSGLLEDRTYLVERYHFVAEQALNILKGWEDLFTRHIVGPPFMINRLLKYLEENNMRLELDEESKIIMLGGWNRFTGEQIPREAFDESCTEYLGIGTHQIRDMYGLVERNFLAIECEKNMKHLPPWVEIVIRNLDNQQQVIRETGKAGLITLLDPTNLSYPCFIETEDIGHIPLDGLCSCRRLSQTIHFEARVAGVELGCCAINLDRYMEEREITRTCDTL
ncbi:LuxE/PaaK family acyltransferase [Candidatus Thiosymbion oneisti]|uniref:LuxE/PaaK family acyltransferase n=1 Tax=Candidatus Thiosymbion oneisti TaxID=589554 RepID=UPI00159F150C|nr:LuxE family acyl-protein synthetase [Candidatus Thiosymbion oneisti]